jgi:site-specific DNA recombinase
MDTPKDVGIWIRVSTEDQARGESPEHHEKRARYYAESKGWKIREVYNLAGVSGKDVAEHPDTKRMLKDIETGHITGLIFSKLARLARNTKQLLDFADYFNKYDADLISLQESIDTSTPAGRLFYTMIAAMAQWEREEIASRVAASVPIRARLGKPLGGAAPFGYQWKDKQLVPDPKEAPIRRQMYELFLQHRRKKTVARLLNEQGFRTRNGSKFSDTTITRLLEDPTAKGLRRANYTKSRGGGKAWDFKPESEWVLSEVEPIVSEDLWNQCKAILLEQEKAHKKPTKRTVYLFAGFVYCGLCGGDQRMYVPSNNPKYICRACKNKIGLEDLEAIFREQLRQFLFSPEDIQQHFENADQELNAKQEVLTSLQSERSKTKAQMDKMMGLFLADQISKEGFGREYKPLEERLRQLHDQIPVLQGEIDFVRIKFQSSEEIVQEAKDLHAKWPDLSQEEKRAIIEQVVEKIVVGKDDIEITLNYLPNSSKLVADGQHNFRAALPFCHLALRAKKPLKRGYPRELRTLGDHIRKKRMELGFTTSYLSIRFGVQIGSILRWEKGLTNPPIRYLPAIYDFLGYAPFRPIRTLSDRLRVLRERLGMTQNELGTFLGVSEYQIWEWENFVGLKTTRACEGESHARTSPSPFDCEDAPA